MTARPESVPECGIHEVCAGGPGPSDFGQWGPSFNPALDDAGHNITIALEQWVEKGTAPEQVIARGNTDASGAGKGTALLGIEAPFLSSPRPWQAIASLDPVGYCRGPKLAATRAPHARGRTMAPERHQAKHRR